MRGAARPPRALAAVPTGAGAVAALVAAALVACGSAPACGGTGAASPAPAAFERCPGTGPRVPGSALPDVVVPCLGPGPAVRLSALRGPLLVNAWGSWCGPCQAEVPVLQRFHAAAGPRVALVGIDVSDSRCSAQDLAGHLGMTYPSVFDDHDQTRAFRGTGAPETFFVDAAGRVAYRQEGPFRDLAQLRALVARHLGVTV